MKKDKNFGLQQQSSVKPAFFGYEKPTPGDVRLVRGLLKMSHAHLACFLGKKFSEKGSSAVRKWELPIEHKDHREIDYNSWRRMLEAAGIVSIEQSLISAAKYLEALDRE
ncbi:hypothetical protein [Shewanella algae]|uniref:hypothetical protein n=1 Tax=Shewanella algae TaxID=38313 RepID=UPI0031F548DF